MPARKQKVDHRRGGGSKHVSSIDEVKARNNGEETPYEKARRQRQGGGDAEESSSGEEAPQAVAREKKSTPTAGIMQVENPNAVKRNEMKDGVELTRKQREELDRAKAQRRYEQLHKEGKTDEAKADLARLAEVKKRREEEAQKRAEEAAAAKQKEEKAGEEKPRGAMINALKEAMGGEGKKKDKDEAQEEGEEIAEKPKKKDKAEGDSWQASIASKTEGAEKKKVTDGTIEQCREAEEDFM